MRKIGRLKCLETHPIQEPVEGQPSLHMILFHGYGADAYDLRSLSEVFTLPPTTHYLFPQGHLEVPIGPGWTGRAWWPINIAALEAAAQSGSPRDLSKENPESLPELREKVIEAIESLKVPWNQIILGGFSQGAMLATDIFLHAPQAPKALISMSGSLLNKAALEKVASQRAGSPFLLTHGQQDAVLNIRGSSQLETFLIQNGLKGKLFTFQGTHEIPPVVVQKINDFLKEIL